MLQASTTRTRLTACTAALGVVPNYTRECLALLACHQCQLFVLLADVEGAAVLGM